MVHEASSKARREDIERKYEQFAGIYGVYRENSHSLTRTASELSYLEQEAAPAGGWRHRELKEKYPGSSVAEYLKKCATIFSTILIHSRSVKRR